MAKGESYEAFVEKFKPKKTTDDCYTPPAVYDAVLGWVRKEYGLGDDVPIVRPFYPGGDYEHYNYPSGCVVVDNPPFSIMAQILRFYNERGIHYFLFAPALTLFQPQEPCCFIVANADVIYANGADVKTSFVTDMDRYKVRIVPELNKAIKVAVESTKNTKKLPKYVLPANVITAARLGRIATQDVPLEILPEDCRFIRKIDAMGKRFLYGGGFLISHRAALAKAEAEAEEKKRRRARARLFADDNTDVMEDGALVYRLSPREQALVAELDREVEAYELLE